MIVTLITKEKIYSMTLPERVSGQYWLSDEDTDGRLRQVLNAEGIQEEWILCSSDTLVLLNEQGISIDSVKLSTTGNCVISAVYRKNGEKAQIYTEPSTVDRQAYQKYCVQGDCELKIGRTDNNQIAFNNRYVSEHHAILLFQNGQWSVVDTQSKNGTFVNGKRIAMEQLKCGDCIYIMGLKILMGGTFFAINHPDDALQINTQCVFPFVVQDRVITTDIIAPPTKERFYRSPRFCKSFKVETIRVDAPPNREKQEEIPLALMLGPALTMGVTALVMGAVAVGNVTNGTSTLASAIPTMVMSLSMLCGTVLWPMLTKSNEKKRKNTTEAKRQAKYREYLDSIRDTLGSLAQAEVKIIQENCPNLLECESRILKRSRALWERSPEHADFLRVRLGTGALPMTVDLKYPDQRFALDDDYLTHDLARLKDEPKQLSNVPITISLKEDSVCGIVGPQKLTLEMVSGMVLQLAALHSSQDLKLVFLIDEEDLPKWEFAKWFPHVWSKDGTMRYLATNEQEVRSLSAQLEHELTERMANLNLQNTAILPHYLLISASSKLSEKAEFFAHALQAPVKAGFSCLILAQTLCELPKECTKAIELENSHSCIYDTQDYSGKQLEFQVETAARVDVVAAAKSLANLELESQTKQFQLPNMITFLEMYGVGKVEHLNVLTRWRENNPVNSLQAPVGVGLDGELFELDLHEKFHGPHGLVAGMTGSGKSEFIITFILSLALNYSPEEVAFILIDYKGGGLTGAFENPERGVRLPHLAGTITNLDGAAVKRSLVSIQSELRRRQAIFNKARQLSGEGTIDIYRYQKMYRNGQVAEPVPHLFIIADEFAELKMQQSEFMQQLISAARIGRSLGVHLILATQKPNGVVDDQIWSNSRFHVCLKVQERADSMDMIKRPDAAEIAETGRFYLQVGFNEYFAVGQSAWSGAPYQPAERVVKKQDDSVMVIDHLGRVLGEAKPKQTHQQATGRGQVVEIVDHLSALAVSEELLAHQLWLPALPAKIYVDSLRQKYKLNVNTKVLAPVIGEYDDPFNQKQGAVQLNLSEQGNALIYGASGSGKVLLLNTMVYDLLNHYKAEDLNLYLIDMGEESLQKFDSAPQVGGVLLAGDSERLVNLFQMLLDEIAQRRRLFAQYGGDYMSACQQLSQQFPQIVVVLHNYATFAEQFEQEEETLLRLTRDGAKYGVYFVLTASSTGAVRYRMMQNFKQTIVLQLNDRSDYVGLLGSTDGVYPSAIYGRGIIKSDRTYEFQTAHISHQDSTKAVNQLIYRLAEQTSTHAKEVPVMPSALDSLYLKDCIALEAFPIGMERQSLHIRTLNLKESMVTVLAAQDTYGLGDPAQGMAEVLVMLPDAKVCVWDGLGLFLNANATLYEYVTDNFEASVNELFHEMVKRNNTYKLALKNQQPLPQYPLWIYEITGFHNIFSQLSDTGKDYLKTLMERAELAYQIRFIICDTAKGLGLLTSDGWYCKFVSGSDGIWVGDGISDQYALKVGKISSDLYTEMPTGFGYAIRRGRPTLIKLLTCQNREEAAE